MCLYILNDLKMCFGNHHIVGYCFIYNLITLINTLIGVFRPCIFNTIIDMIEFKSAILLVFCLSHLFFCLFGFFGFILF